MSRNLRNSDHPAPNAVDTYPIAPDYYNDGSQDEVPYHDTYREFVNTIPYKRGDVVYVEHWTRNGKQARKAVISEVFAERKNDGFIQRGYQKAAN